MPKRFTDTEKWKKPFLRNLKAPYKLLWFYILDECDHAGIWQVDFDVARLKIGEKLNQEDAIKFLGDKIVELDGGEKWFVPSFIEFQYGKLAENNRAHTKAISALRKHRLLDGDLNITVSSPKKNKPLISPLASPLQGAKEEVEEQEQVQEQEGEQETAQTGARKFYTFSVLPWDSDSFREAWATWKTYKHEQHKFIYKGSHSEQQALINLSELAEGREDTALAIIRQSMGNGWAGLFKLKKDKHEQPNSKNRTAADQNDYERELASRIGLAPNQSGFSPI